MIRGVIVWSMETTNTPDTTDTTARRAALLRDLRAYEMDLTAAEAEYARCERLVAAMESVDVLHLGLNEAHLADAKRAKDRAWDYAVALGAMVETLKSRLDALRW